MMSRLIPLGPSQSRASAAASPRVEGDGEPHRWTHIVHDHGSNGGTSCLAPPSSRLPDFGKRATPASCPTPCFPPRGSHSMDPPRAAEDLPRVTATANACHTIPATTARATSALSTHANKPGSLPLVLSDSTNSAVHISTATTMDAIATVRDNTVRPSVRYVRIQASAHPVTHTAPPLWDRDEAGMMVCARSQAPVLHDRRTPHDHTDRAPDAPA